MLIRNYDNFNCFSYQSSNFKSYYLEQVTQQWGQAFPKLPSYQRFIEWIPSTLLPFCVYLKHCCGQCTGISFADSTALKVCHNRRISRHKVFKNLAQRVKTSVDWFFGFKLHLVVNERGELLNVILTTGNVDDRKPIPELLANIFGTVFAGRQRRTFGDWGYVSAKLATQLLYQFSKV
ncbi:IS982 family transposase [Microcystis aeruginosa CS-555/01A07]|nr:IS982 family transposase [Microcystis aeruginosa]MDB9429203.1 IS982 family transposase [Microcystis aeruginosa CS-555/01A07]